ncbi:DNA/RNA non-specific endonuclease [Bacillus vallismortis]|uniref:DNA/RNA non-specific endonuclease n=1 Tax=Bacillus vallismortis TaxID=72361 RepID=UPI00374DF368
MSIGEGFDPTFLGLDYPIPFPTLREDTENVALEEGKIFNFTHFSIVMNRERKFPIYGSNNTNLGSKKSFDRVGYYPDSEIGEEYQVGSCLYNDDNNVWDRGHLVKRGDEEVMCVGANVKKPNKQTKNRLFMLIEFLNINCSIAQFGGK